MKVNEKSTKNSNFLWAVAIQDWAQTESPLNLVKFVGHNGILAKTQKQ